MGRLVFLVVLGCLTIGLGFFWLVSRWRESAHTAAIGAVLVGVGVVVAGLATSGLRKLSRFGNG